MNMNRLDTETLFRGINTEYQRVRKNYDHVSQNASSVIQEAKSSAEAEKFSYKGDRAFIYKKDLYEAVEWYSKSVAMAPIGSEKLGMAYVKRSEALLKLGKYVSCLLDVNRALKSGKYPSSLEQILFDTKSLCMAHIQLTEKSNKISGDEVDPVDVGEHDSTFRSWVSTFNNTLLPHTVSKIGLKYDEGLKKLFMVATEDIEPGEILSSEELSVFVVFSHGRYRQCSYCLKECSAMIPCPYCSMVMYCSEECRTGAYNSYHRVECKIILSGNEYNWFDVLAIRAFLVGTQQGAMLEELMRTLSVEQILERGLANTLGKPFTNDYRNYLRVSGPFIPSSLNSFIPMAVRAVLMLKNVGFFQNALQVEQEDLDPTGIYAIALLLFNYCSLEHMPSYYLACDGSCGQTADVRSIAYFVLHSLIDYSCIPNTDAFMRKRKHTLFSVRRIKKDEYITFRYKHYISFESMPKSERTSILMSDYKISCPCEPCEKNWPTFEELITLPIQYQYEASSRFAVVIDTITKLLKPLIEEENLDELEVIWRLSRVVGLLYENVKLPSGHIEFYKHYLGLCMKVLYDEPNQQHLLIENNQFDRKLFSISQMNLICKGAITYISPWLIKIDKKIYEHAMKCLKNRCKYI